MPLITVKLIDGVFSEAQKAFILKQGSDGAGGGHLPEGWDQPGDLLQLEEALRGHAAAGDATAEAA